MAFLKDSENRQRWTLVITMSTLGLALAGVAAWLRLGWPVAAVSTFLEVGLVCGYLLWTRDPLARTLLVFAVVVGFGELPTDAFSVVVKQTLVYPPGEILIWASPYYMPFSWIAVMVQMGFIAWWLVWKVGLLRSTVIMAALGASYVPLFEYLAHAADFWYYRDCRMFLGVTPYYVILAESLLLAALPLLVRDLERRSWTGLICLGVAESLVVYLSSRLAFMVVG
jgi:hypothetical protein